MIGLQMFSTYSTSYIAGAMQSGQGQNVQKSTAKAEPSTDNVKKQAPSEHSHGQKPPAGPSGQEMSGRFTMMIQMQIGGKPKPPDMVSHQLSEAGIDLGDFDAKEFDEAIGEAISGLSSRPDKDTMEDIILSALEEQGIDTEELDLELPDHGQGGRPPPPMSGGISSHLTSHFTSQGQSSVSLQQQAVMALFQTNQQMTSVAISTTSFYA